MSRRATGITAYLENGGTLEHAQQAFAEGFGSQADLSAEDSAPKADHRARAPRKTKLYDRTTHQVSLAEIDRIAT